MLAATGPRVWEPTPDAPALVILADEYAEPADDAPEATSDADSTTRRGRAVAVNPGRRNPAARAEGKGPGRAALTGGRAGPLPRPQT
jgi:hypothetical protein